MSISWHLDAEPEPRILVLPPAAASLDEAHAAIELWEHYSGKTLDPTQRLVVEVMMAERADGKWAAATTGREMPRQNGKGDEIEVVELWGLVQRGEAILHTIHDAVLLATQAQQRMLNVLSRPDLRVKKKREWLGTGQQMIEMRNGGIIWYRTRTGGGGRGVDDVDRLVIDEAQHATEEHLSAVSPTLLANANPQLNAMGTSGLAGKSDWWWMIRRRALGNDPGSFGYVGHTAEHVSLDERGAVVQEPVDVTDRRLWVLTNPSIARKPDVEDFLEEQLRTLGPDSFGREHLGVWDPVESNVHPAKLDAELWAATRKPVTAGAGPFKLAYDVDLDGAWSSIVISAGNAAAPYIELVDHRKGVAWLPGRLAELIRQWKPAAVGYNAAGPALAQVGAITVEFREKGISPEVLVPLSASDYRAACEQFAISVNEGRLSRPNSVDQPSLDLAGEKATERPLNEGWVWHRRDATVPISPLVAATAAAFLLPTPVEETWVPRRIR